MSAAFEVRGLSVDYVGPSGPVRVVDDVSLAVRPGELHGLVGESGCGKSTLARAALRVLGPPAIVTGGEVRLGDVDLLALTPQQLDAVRWRRVSIVFQGAIDALNPLMRVETQLADALAAHGQAADAARRVDELLAMVSLPARVKRAWPHELSGGMRQRVVIAMALALEPEVLVMDEPTTALDVVVQAELLDELDRLRREKGFSVLLVSHDLPLMLERCDSLSVMYAGRIVEQGPVADFRAGPKHPYAKHLLEAFPRLEGPKVLPTALPGAPPPLASPPPGCRFHPRCPAAFERCPRETPALLPVSDAHVVACHLVHSK